MFQQTMHSLRRATVRTMVGGTVVVGAMEVTTHLPSQGRSSQFYHSLADDWVVPAMRKVLPPELAHKAALKMAFLAPTHRPSAKEQKLNVGVTLWENVHFHSPIGLAAGYDKDATAIAPLLGMGFSFCEIGSVCLRPQPGNPSPRMFRLIQDEGIINRYGFNSEGVHVVEQNLKEFRELQASSKATPEEEKSTWQKAYNLLWPGSNSMLTTGVVGVNLGKNKTSETALEDYQTLIRQLGPYADYLVINVSSPNTPGLRDMQETTSLEGLLTGCQEACRELSNKTPLLVKLSPDLTNDEMKDIAKLLMSLEIDGIILTNTTIARPASLVSPDKKKTGGLSGKPLKNRSTECIRLLYECTKGQIPIIGVGGVQNGSDAYEKLRAGASVVQIYSGMIYEGPGIASKIRDEVAELMMQNGQRNLQEEVVGSAHEQLHWEKQRAVLEKRNSATTTMVIDKEDKDSEEQQQQEEAVSPQPHILATEVE